MAADLEKIREMAERVATSEGLALVDVELKGGRSNALLRVYIDKPGGVSHADCALVSEQLSAMLDVEDPFPGRYMLEVSSPGLDRELTKPSDFEHFAGRRARVVLREAGGESKRFWKGAWRDLKTAGCGWTWASTGCEELELANIRKPSWWWSCKGRCLGPSLRLDCKRSAPGANRRMRLRVLCQRVFFIKRSIS